MSHKMKHWGELEDSMDEQLAYIPKVNLANLIETALQPNCESAPPARGRAVALPVDNLSLKTVRLVEHNRQVAAAMAGAQVPPSPPTASSVDRNVNNNFNFKFVQQVHIFGKCLILPTPIYNTNFFINFNQFPDSNI